MARSDYGIYLPILRRIQSDPELRLHLIVSGMHLSPEFGLTMRLIEQDGFTIADRVEMLLSSDSPEGIAKSMGLGVIGFAQSYARLRPDVLVVLGDRFEMYAAALAALPFTIPTAHIHGGEVTQGAIDEALRHSMTKLSHLHFVATEDYARRVIQMGEEPWRVIVTGALSLDNLRGITLWDRSELKRRFGIEVSEAELLLLVTYHPVTLEYEQTEWQVSELLAALEEINLPVVFTLSNADTNSRVIIQKIDEYISSHPSAQKVETLGVPGYFSLMSVASAMVGNSSSGIIEAASFELPVVNIGNRQKGRIHGANVVDVDYDRRSICAGIRRALSLDFWSALQGMHNPYSAGVEAARLIVDKLKSLALDKKLIQKAFYDIR